MGSFMCSESSGRLPPGRAAQSSPLGLTPGVPRAGHADWPLGLHSQPPYSPRTHSRPGGAAATWGVARGWYWDRTPSRPGCVGPAFPGLWRLRARRVPRSTRAEFPQVSRPGGQRRWRVEEGGDMGLSVRESFLGNGGLDLGLEHGGVDLGWGESGDIIPGVNKDY